MHTLNAIGLNSTIFKGGYVFKSYPQMRNIACEVTGRISLRCSKFMRTVHYGTWEEYITYIPKYSIMVIVLCILNFLGVILLVCSNTYSLLSFISRIAYHKWIISHFLGK